MTAMTVMARVLAFLLVVVCCPLAAAAAAAAAAEETPSTRFSGNMTDLRSTLRGLTATIDAYNRAIKDVTDFDIEAAKLKVAEIREQVRHLLDQLSDGSPLAKSHYELTRWIERNRRLVRTDTLLSSERKALLERAWAQRAEEVDTAGKEIAGVRKLLIEQLNKMIGDETYLTQLLFLEKAGEAAALIRQFLLDIKTISDQIRQRMEAVPVPGPGT